MSLYKIIRKGFMKWLFINSDIEGTAHLRLEETDRGRRRIRIFPPRQMSGSRSMPSKPRAGTEDCTRTGPQKHRPAMLPRKHKNCPGLAGDPLCMMSGLDRTFDAVAFTGYHSWASGDGNPSPTMTTQIDFVKINGELASNSPSMPTPQAITESVVFYPAIKHYAVPPTPALSRHCHRSRK